MRLFIAGCEGEQNRMASMIANNPNMLLSYYHLTGGKHKMDAQFVKNYHNLKGSNAQFIMDSGLFTMMFGAGAGKKYDIDDLMNYTHRYLNNVNTIRYNDYIVEMDVHKLFGHDKVQIFRDEFIKHYDINKIIFVWHIEEKIEGWREMCKKYPYVALSIPELRIVMKRKYLKAFMQKMIRIANEINPNIKIHLLGCTSNDLLEQGNYYSADSTSWMGGIRYGIFTVPHNKHRLNFKTLSALSLSKDKIVLENMHYLINKYKMKPDTSNIERRDISAVCIAFYVHMAQNISRDYFNREYSNFDDNLIDLLERV